MRAGGEGKDVVSVTSVSVLTGGPRVSAAAEKSRRARLLWASAGLAVPTLSERDSWAWAWLGEVSAGLRGLFLFFFVTKLFLLLFLKQQNNKQKQVLN